MNSKLDAGNLIQGTNAFIERLKDQEPLTAARVLLVARYMVETGNIDYNAVLDFLLEQALKSDAWEMAKALSKENEATTTVIPAHKLVKESNRTACGEMSKGKKTSYFWKFTTCTKCLMLK